MSGTSSTRLDLDTITGHGPSAVTIGKFDGVHRGHRAVLHQLESLADERGLAKVVLTFDRNPLSVVAPAKCPPDLVSLEQKLELLGAEPVDEIVVLPFTPEFAAREPIDFVDDILVGRLQAKLLLVGADFRFGHRGAGDVALLTELGASRGFEVVVIDDELIDGERVSSSRIRAALAAGDVATAAALLGRPPAIRGPVIRGDRRGRELGYPTANVDAEAEGLTPADGVYAGWLTDADGRYPAAISVGTNPTFDGVVGRRVEAHLPGVDLDLYDRVVIVEFLERLRGMERFDSVEALVAQMRDDVVAALDAVGRFA